MNLTLTENEIKEISNAFDALKDSTFDQNLHQKLIDMVIEPKKQKHREFKDIITDISKSDKYEIRPIFIDIGTKEKLNDEKYIDNILAVSRQLRDQVEITERILALFGKYTDKDGEEMAQLIGFFY